MSPVGKVETVVGVKVPAAKFHELFSFKAHVVASMSPQSVQVANYWLYHLDIFLFRMFTSHHIMIILSYNISICHIIFVPKNVTTIIKKKKEKKDVYI